MGRPDESSVRATYCTGALELAGGAGAWFSQTGVLLQCPRSDASPVRHADPGPLVPAVPSAGASEGDVGAGGPIGLAVAGATSPVAPD